MFETPKSRREFIQALKTGKISPNILAKAQANVGAFSDCTQEEIQWALNHNLPQIKEFAQSVQLVMQGGGKLPLLIQQLKTERNPARQAEIAQSIADSQDPEVLTELSQMINDKNIESRKAAIVLLMKVEDWPRQKRLVRALIQDPKSEISDSMLRHIIQAAPRRYIKEVRQAASHESDDLRTLALKTIVTINDTQHGDLLIQRLAYEKGELQKSLYGAIIAFIKADPKAMLEHIVKATANTEANERQTAMNLLTKHPDQCRAFRRLLAFSESVSTMLRDQIFAEMAKVPDAFVDHILALFKTENDRELRMQALLLAKLFKHPKLTPIFLHEMKNPDWMVRYAAMQVLGDMKSQQALPVLVEAMGKDVTSSAAIQALGKYKDLRLAKPFFQKLPNASESDQIEILNALSGTPDARLLPTLAKFLDSNAPKGKAKLHCAEVLMEMCKATNTKVPPKVTQIYEQIREKTVDDLPDLGLKLSDN